MKKILLLFVFVFSSLVSCTQEETTTYYLIRHAEKNLTKKNPNLIEEGIKRANNWATYFKDIPLDAVYTTNFNRTKQTAAPTATHKGLKPIIYKPNKLYTTTFKKRTKGKTTLIVGHSNTIPFLVNKIIGENKYDEIDESNYANLYIIHISGDKITASLQQIN
ncbi:histidine phosphatase family protein [uncultured Polaribacter sp.]|uniref:SixA phosphatase family protein n=1 Tax=uncultured Polaribacter sp. TaxID=174711 RepID=UPI002628CEA7|nr:phosphoglycerate mutase family protein [uncultured Polaribacter sp.]